MKKILLLMILVCSMNMWAQSSFPYAKLIPNDPTTGTTQFTLTKVNSSGNAQIMGTSDVNGYEGVCVENCGKSGSAWIAFAGLVPVTVTGTTTIQHYITFAGTTAGEGTDSGASTWPTGSGTLVIGRVQTPSTGATSVSLIDLFAQETLIGSVTIASNSTALATGSISSASCATTTASASGVASTDSIIWTPNASLSGVTGYIPSGTTDSLRITAYPTTNNVNFVVCNWTASPITPGAVTLNWRVIR